MGQDDDSARTSYPGDEPLPFEQVARLFDGARELEGQARRDFLQREADENDALRREVERLLGLHEAESGVLDEDHSEVNPTLAIDALEEHDPPTANPVPETIGHYRVERRLGRGGMGQVFLAVRSDGDFEKRVAIKVLRPGMDDADLLRRFRSERRILAHLEHPNIATLIDGGAMPDGRPYVVMEHVEGKDVIRYAQDDALDLASRLRLFLRICHAVEYAHRNLVVHRDLKPSNILVTADGQPKLLDFGIAKLLDTEVDTDHSIARTLTGMGLFTPEYASPEQVRGAPITTATDVYSLGAMLYELLTDVRAHPLETRLPAEVDRIVCQTVPAAPSAAQGSPMSTRWRRRLGGDLDNITLMALRKEPHRRYGSVSALSEDIQRFLDDLPVHARRDTFGYRASKFVRRNAWGVAFAALMLVLLGTFAVVMAVQAQRIARERDIATRESAIAGQVSGFLVELFRGSDPYHSGGGEVLARTLLDDGARRITQELSSVPLVRAELMETMGNAYMALGLFEEARPLLTGALALREAGGTAAQRAEARGLVGILERGAGRYEEARRLMQESLAELERQGVASERSSTIQTELASLLSELGHGQEALDLTEKAYATRTELYAPPHRSIAAALAARANAHQDLGQFEPAEELFLEALAMQEQIFGSEHPECAVIHADIADLYKLIGRMDEGMRHLEEALRIDIATLGEDHPQVNNDTFGLAQLVENTGDFPRAEQLYREILERDRALSGDRHPHVALDLASIASVLSDQGRFEEAEAFFQEALAMQMELLPEDAPEIATTLSNMGALYRRWGKYEEAHAYLEDALARRELIFPPDHPTVLTARTMIAVAMVDDGRFAEAEAIHRDVLEARRAKLGLHPHVGGSLFGVAMCRQRLRDLDGAVDLMRQAVEVYEQTLPADHIDLARALVQLGVMRLRLDLPLEALDPLRRGLAIRAAKLPEDHLDVAEARHHLGKCLARLPEPGDFEPLFEAALIVYRDRLGENHPRTLQVRNDFAVAFEQVGRPEDAQSVRRGDRP